MSAFLLEPLQGRTQLWRVVLIYGLGVNCALSLAALPFQPLQPPALWPLLALGLIVGLYQLFALWQCAYNSRFRPLGSIVRACVAASILAVPLFIYIFVTQQRMPLTNGWSDRGAEASVRQGEG